MSLFPTGPNLPNQTGQPWVSLRLAFLIPNNNERIIMKNNIIELPVAELKMALPGLAKIIGRKTTLPVLSAVRVTRDQAGLITLQGTDLDSTATFTLKDKSEGPATQLLVPLERLQKAVKQTNGKVELSLSTKDEVLVRTFWRDTPMEEKISVPYHDDWPKQPEVASHPVKLTKHFRTTFKEAMECASEDSSRAVINSVYLDVDDQKGHYVVATDGRHLFSANSFAFDFKQSVIIPTRKFLAWHGWWTEGEGTLAIKPPTKSTETTWLQFTAGEWTFLTRGQDQPFPKWKNCVPNDECRTTVTIPEQAIGGVLEVLARLPGLDDHNNGVHLNASTSTFVLTGRDKDQAQAVSVPIVEAQIEGLPSGVTLNREYMIRALKFGLNEINLVDALSPIVFKAAGRKMIVMPLRPDATAAAVPATPPTEPPTPQTSAAALPSASAPPTEPTTETERKNMPTNTNTMTPPERGSLKAHPNGEETSAFKAVVEQIESIKTKLRETLGELNEALALIKAAEKEKRLNEKEMDSVRTTLRSLQKVQI